LPGPDPLQSHIEDLAHQLERQAIIERQMRSQHRGHRAILFTAILAAASVAAAILTFR
jgi:hypothetical protein